MTPDELWKKHVIRTQMFGDFIDRPNFLTALSEYGAAVRKRDAEIVNAMSAKRFSGRHVASSMNLPCDCAAAISREPLP